LLSVDKPQHNDGSERAIGGSFITVLSTFMVASVDFKTDGNRLLLFFIVLGKNI